MPTAMTRMARNVDGETSGSASCHGQTLFEGTQEEPREQGSHGIGISLKRACPTGGRTESRPSAAPKAKAMMMNR